MFQQEATKGLSKAPAVHGVGQAFGTKDELDHKVAIKLHSKRTGKVY